MIHLLYNLYTKENRKLVGKMSRSYKKHPYICCACYKSNKRDKTLANRIFRHRTLQNIRSGKEPLYSLKQVSDTYNFPSDGLAYYYPRHRWNSLLRRGFTEEEINMFYRHAINK